MNPLPFRDAHITLVNRFFTDRPHFSSQTRITHTLAYQFSGVYHHDFGDTVQTAEPDMLLFLYNRAAYRVTTETPGTSVSFHFTAAESDLSTNYFISCANRPEIRQVFLQALEWWSAATPTATCMVYAKFYEALSAFCTLCSEPTDFAYLSADNRAAVARAVAYIHRHLSEKIELPVLAAQSGKGVRRLNDLFKAATGQSPLTYVNALRLTRAKQYLESGQYSVAEIAHMVGFADECYFNRLFRDKNGVSPGRYRTLIAERLK